MASEQGVRVALAYRLLIADVGQQGTVAMFTVWRYSNVGTEIRYVSVWEKTDNPPVGIVTYVCLHQS